MPVTKKQKMEAFSRQVQFVKEEKKNKRKNEMQPNGRARKLESTQARESPLSDSWEVVPTKASHDWDAEEARAHNTANLMLSLFTSSSSSSSSSVSLSSTPPLSSLPAARGSKRKTPPSASRDESYFSRSESSSSLSSLLTTHTHIHTHTDQSSPPPSPIHEHEYEEEEEQSEPEIEDPEFVRNEIVFVRTVSGHTTGPRSTGTSVRECVCIYMQQ
jgi:hypothetical protein